MSERRDSLRDDLRGLADAYASAAAPEAEVAARLHARLGGRTGRSFALAAAVALVILVAAVLRSVTPSDVGPPVMPALTGVFRTIEPDPDGRCFAVRLYDTTPADGRAFAFAWTGQDGCASRRSNMTSAEGRAEAVRLAAVAEAPSRVGILISAGPTVPAALAGLVLVLDPASAPAGSGVIPGYRSVPLTADEPSIDLLRVDELDVPYVPG